MVLAEAVAVTASDWVKGIALSVTASIIGGASKLAIRKSWLLEHEENESMRVSHHAGSESLPSGRMEPVTVCCSDAATTDGANPIKGLWPGSGGKTRGHLLTDETEPMEDFENNLLDDDDISESGFAISTDYDSEVPLLRSCSPSSLWIYGLRSAGMFGMSVLNPLCGVFAMNYASPSILAPFSGLTLVWIILFSFPLIGEKPAPRQVVAAALIVLGEVVVAIFGDHTNDGGHTVEDVVSQKTREDARVACEEWN